MKVLLLQLDGKTPNLALMRVSAHFKAKGGEVHLRQARRLDSVERGLFDDWDFIFASTIFTRTRPVAERLAKVFPDAFIGGTGWNLKTKLEDFGISTQEADYSLYPAFRHSMGFTQRGCRLHCKFCVVPEKEGDVHHDQTIWEIWRGDPWPRELLLLDNDFFGNPDWRKRIEEINVGRFKVCFNQGFNVRLIGDEEAAALATVRYYDDQFERPRLYTAWDNRNDEKRLFRNLELLAKHGVRPDNIVVYMLVGYWNGPTLGADDFYRHAKLREFGCRPYPMPYVRNEELRGFQRWIVRRADLNVPWEAWKRNKYRGEGLNLLAS